MSICRRSGFTLIELLMVMLIIFVLMGIVIWTFTAVMRRKAIEPQTVRLRDLKAAMETYTSLWNFPPLRTDNIFNGFNPTTASPPAGPDQNAAVVDNLSYAGHDWNQKRGVILSRSNPNYEFSSDKPVRSEGEDAES